MGRARSELLVIRRTVGRTWKHLTIFSATLRMERSNHDYGICTISLAQVRLCNHKELIY
jgi:hypothetical protein